MATFVSKWPSSVMAVISVPQPGHFIDKHCSWPPGPIGKEVPGNALKCKPSALGQGHAQWRRTKSRSQDIGCATRNGQSCPAGLPIVVEFTAVTAATDGDDRIGAANGPEHSGAFEPGADEGLAARFDHSGTHEQSLLTELRVTHARGVALEIVGLRLDVLCQLQPFGAQGAQAIHQWFDLAVIQEMLMTHHPASFGRHIAGIELAAELPQVLSGVIKIHDFG